MGFVGLLTVVHIVAVVMVMARVVVMPRCLRLTLLVIGRAGFIFPSLAIAVVLLVGGRIDEVAGEAVLPSPQQVVLGLSHNLVDFVAETCVVITQLVSGLGRRGTHFVLQFLYGVKRFLILSDLFLQCQHCVSQVLFHLGGLCLIERRVVELASLLLLTRVLRQHQVGVLVEFVPREGILRHGWVSRGRTRVNGVLLVVVMVLVMVTAVLLLALLRVVFRTLAIVVRIFTFAVTLIVVVPVAPTIAVV